MSKRNKLISSYVKAAALGLSFIMTTGTFYSCKGKDCSDDKSSNVSKNVINTADEAINMYLDTLEVKRGEEHYSCIYSEKDLQEYKDGGQWDKILKAYDDYIASECDSGKVSVESVKQLSQLSDELLGTIGRFLKQDHGMDISPTDGYEYEATVIFKKDDPPQTLELFAINTEDEGWKVFDENADYLDEFYYLDDDYDYGEE
ncbi:MAG TPA: hypothetical protein P5191_01365 [Ruminococcus sp.]|nr:hypothetical protein [Ruminococcus sp.]